MDLSQQQTNSGDHPQRRQHPLANYKFTPEELKVLKDCNTESFYQRSLPLGTGLGLGAWFAVKNGYLKGNSRFGAVPKVIVGTLIGYFVGKFSYQTKCAEKIMKLPNSKLAELLRQRKRGGIYESLSPDQGFGTGLSLPGFSSQSDSYSDEIYKQQNSLNLDTERPQSGGLDDVYRPTLDSPVTKFEDDLPLNNSKQTTTYDELRQKNRAEYQKKFQGGGSSNPPVNPGPPQFNEDERPPPIRRQEVPNQEANVKKNKYGDVWTN